MNYSGQQEQEAFEASMRYDWEERHHEGFFHHSDDENEKKAETAEKPLRMPED
jgi:hypothetical protein